MADKKNDSGFTVTDRRLFTPDGDLRSDVPEETEAPKQAIPAAPPKDASAEKASKAGDSDAAKSERDMPPPPTAAEQQAQADAYRESSRDLDKEVELSGHSAKDFEITFERFLASLYMTAMLQLGLMRQRTEDPRVDIVGARQTIDTLSLIGEKTKGNLTPVE